MIPLKLIHINIKHYDIGSDSQMCLRIMQNLEEDKEKLELDTTIHRERMDSACSMGSVINASR